MQTRTSLLGHSQIRTASGRHRTLLYIAAAFNLVAVPLILLLSRFEPQWLGLDAPRASQQFYVDLSALLIAGFGLGYARAARDLTRFWPIVALGAVCKAGVATLAAVYFLAGDTGLLVVLMASGDAVFAVLFVRLLRQHAVAARGDWR